MVAAASRPADTDGVGVVRTWWARRAARLLGRRVGLLVVASVVLVGVVDATMGGGGAAASAARNGGTAGGVPRAGVRAAVIADLDSMRETSVRVLDRSAATALRAISPRRAVLATLKHEVRGTRAIGLSLARESGPAPQGHPGELIWIVEVNHPGGIAGGPSSRSPMDYAVWFVDARTGAVIFGQAAHRPGLTPPPVHG
jgi:hypothetical protein